MDMRLYRRGKYWYVSISRTKAVSLRTTDEALAREAFREMKRLDLEGRLAKLTVGPGMRLAEFVDHYLALREGTIKPSTMKEYRAALMELLECMGDIRMDALSRRLAEFRSHVAMRFRSAWTMNKTLRHVKTALIYAVRQEHCRLHLEELVAFKVDLAKPIYLTAPQVREMIAWARGEHGQLRALRPGRRREYDLVNHQVMGVAVAVMFGTGISRAEICAPLAVYPDVIQYKRQKTGQLVTVPVAEWLRPHVAHLRQGVQRIVPWGPRTLSRHFQIIARAAGHPEITPHKVRHTFATLMTAAGVPITTISKLLGHADEYITMRFYAHVTDEGMRRAVDSMGL